MKIIFIITILTFSVFGQSLQQVVKKGLELDSRIKVLVQEYKIALKDIDIVEANYLPTVDVSAFAGKERTKTPANPNETRVLSVKNAAITAKYNLFSGYKKKFLVQEKKATARLAENKLKEGLIAVSQEISMAYIDMIKRYQIYNKYKKNINNYKSTLKKVSFKIKDGGGRDSDLFQTKSRMNYEETNLLTAKQAYEDSKIVLAKYLKRVPSISGMRDPRVNTKYLNLSSLIRKTRKYNASLGNLIFQKEISQSFIGQEKSKYYPTIDLEISKNWASDQHGILGIDESDRIGVNLKYNIYNGGSNDLSMERAKMQTLKAGDSIKDASREVIVNVKRNYNNYKLYKQKLSAINKHIKNAKKTERLYMKEEEETGERSIIDILNIQQEYNSAEIARIDAKYTAMQLYYQLIASTSEILDYFKISKR